MMEVLRYVLTIQRYTISKRETFYTSILFYVWIIKVMAGGKSYVHIKILINQARARTPATQQRKCAHSFLNHLDF